MLVLDPVTCAGLEILFPESAPIPTTTTTTTFSPVVIGRWTASSFPSWYYSCSVG